MAFDVAIGDAAALDDWLIGGAPEVRTFDAAHAQAIMDLATALDGIGDLLDERGATSVWRARLPLGLAAVLLEWADEDGVSKIVDERARDAATSVLDEVRGAAGGRVDTIDLAAVKSQITASMPEDWRTSW